MALTGCLISCLTTVESTGEAQVSLAWTARFSGPSNVIDQAQAIVSDVAGNVYVTGGADRNGPLLGGDIVTVKYDAHGHQIWVARYGNPGVLADAPTAMTIDASGHVYVTGYSYSQPSLVSAQDIVTLKYAPDGRQLWAARYNTPINTNAGTMSVDYPRAIAVDADGNVYVTGSTSDPFGNSRDYATVKYSADGQERWAVTFDSPGHGNDSPTSLAVNRAGEVYVGGYSAVVKYGAGGQRLWVRSTPVADVALDQTGNVITVGPSFLETSDYGEQPDIQVSKYSPDGDVRWTFQYDASLGEADAAAQVRIDLEDNIYVTGNSASRCRWIKDDGHDEKVCDLDIVTLKLDAGGQRLWAARYDGTNPGVHFPVGMELDAQGNVFVLASEGSWARTGVLKYRPDGSLAWADVYSVTNHGWDSPAGLAVTGDGHLYVAGSSHWSTGGSSDYFVLKYEQEDVPGFPAIVSWPGDRITNAGEGISFPVSATGSAPLRYQWHVNGRPIEGATNATIAIAATTPTDAGDYSVNICNDRGCITSPLARLTVEAPLLRLHSVWKTPEAFGFQIDATSAKPFWIETSTDLRNWTVLSTNAGPVVELPFSFPNSGGAPRFFRAQIPAE